MIESNLTTGDGTTEDSVVSDMSRIDSPGGQFKPADGSRSNVPGNDIPCCSTGRYRVDTDKNGPTVPNDAKNLDSVTRREASLIESATTRYKLSLPADVEGFANITRIGHHPRKDGQL